MEVAITIVLAGLPIGIVILRTIERRVMRRAWDEADREARAEMQRRSNKEGKQWRDL